MATFLYRLGRLAFRRRGYVALIWLAIFTAVGLGALQAPGASDEEFSMPGIESQKAYDLMQERFPGAAADGATERPNPMLGSPPPREGDVMTDQLTVSVLGTGIMGAAMARNLARAGHTVRAWNRSRAKAEPLAADGIAVAGTPAEAVEGADGFAAVGTGAAQAAIRPLLDDPTL
ncbi:NAD(P)-binding domain-containing protein, partial [Streptomyces sp. NPDC058642]|uniref:NAD(P)-binding domain-containing protein n=1 Tax=Streptomyces sp. NPDC058642 TaxID=3346572 RepID=UPI00364C8190